MEIIILVSIVSLISGLTVAYLYNKQSKLVKNIKVGDEVILEDMVGEVVEKVDDNKFIVKLEVPGMRLSKR